MEARMKDIERKRIPTSKRCRENDSEILLATSTNTDRDYFFFARAAHDVFLLLDTLPNILREV